MSNSKAIEQYIEDAHSDLQNWADTLLDELREFANDNDLEPAWVMQAFAYKLNYRINEFCKKG